MSTLKGLLAGQGRIALFLFGLVTLAWFPLVAMDFWQDDRALVFKLQHPYESAGLFGKTLWGEGPYRGTAAIVYPLWLLFGLHPAPYFAASMAGYWLAALAIFWLGKKIFGRTDLALIMAALFAVSHFGADAMLRIINSYQNLLALAGAVVTIGFFLHYLKSRNLFWYAAALIIFIATTEATFIRSAGLALAVLAADLAFAPLSLTRKGLAELVVLVIRQLPFVLVFHKMYLASPTPSDRLGDLVAVLFEKKQFEAVFGFLHTIGNLVIPDQVIGFFTDRHVAETAIAGTVLLLIALFTNLLRASSGRAIAVKTLWLMSYLGWFLLNSALLAKGFRAYQSLGIGFSQAVIGGGALLLILFCIVWFWQAKPIFARALLFGIVSMIAFFIPNWVQYPTDPFTSTHRYLTSSLIGWATIAAALIGIASEAIELPRLRTLKQPAKQQQIFAAALILPLLLINLHYLGGLARSRAQPSKRFYSELRRLTPSLEKGSIIYFAIEPGDENLKKEFRDFFSVGSMPDETALSIYYGIDRYDLTIAETMDELFSLAVKEERPPEALYFFRYTKSGLINLSDEFRKLVKDGGTFKQSAIEISQHQTGKADFPEITGYLPRLLTVQYHFNLNRPESIPFEKSGISPDFARRLEAARQFFELAEQTTIRAASEWRFHEVANAFDDDKETTWLAHRIHFHDTSKEELIIDLGGKQRVSGLWWINGHTSRTATDYQIAVSQDGARWQTVKEVRGGPSRPSSELIKENFPVASASALRLTITATDRGDSPEIAELYPIPDIDETIELPDLLGFIQDPFVLAASAAEYRELEEFFVNHGLQLTLALGRKANIIARRPLIYPGSHELSVQLPGSNEAIKKIYFGPMRLPGKLTIKSLEVTVPPMSELKTKGLIKEFSEN